MSLHKVETVIGQTFENSGVFHDRRDPEDSNKISVAQQRWRILREALVGGRSSLLTSRSSVSVRRFNSFGLLETSLLPDSEQEHDADWFVYTAPDWPDFKMNIRHLPGIVKPETLLGFNNTGNVCVWPSEEVLTYFCLKNKDFFRGKSVCELGGGMTCLAGVALSISTDVSYMELTDGNEESVENLVKVIERNQTDFSNTSVQSSVLRWGCGPLDEDLVERFDRVLCADCLFFEEGRDALVDTIHTILKTEGEAFLFAPPRGNTFDAFVNLAQEKFHITVQENYDEKIWNIHCKMKEKGIELYDPNIHYPQFLHLVKIPKSRENSLER